MGWIADVITRTTIASTWGNAIRDRVVHQFANKTERDQSAVPREGMMCQTADTGIVYVNHGGAWWVVEMPWQTFTVHAWGGNPSPPNVELAIVGSSAGRWKQRMGDARVMASFQANFAPFAGIDSVVGLWSPVQTANAGPMGVARATPFATAVASGGWAAFIDHAPSYPALQGGSRVIVGGAGVQSAINTIVRVTAGSPNVAIECDLSFECDPTKDVGVS